MAKKLEDVNKAATTSDDMYRKLSQKMKLLTTLQKKMKSTKEKFKKRNEGKKCERSKKKKK